jgi:glycosyltransferase involved in cell wall biosynthesis
MRIALINNQYHGGGAETAVHQLWRGFPESQMFVEDAYHLPARVHSLYPAGLSRLYHSRFNYWVDKFFPKFRWTDRAFRKLASDKFDIIHIHNFHGQYASIDALAELASKKPVTWTFHGLWGVTGGCDFPDGCIRFRDRCGECPQIGVWPIGPVDNTQAQLADKKRMLANLSLHVIAPSRFFESLIRSSPTSENWRVHHIPNGIDTSLFKPLSKDEQRLKVLLVCRDFTEPRKGFDRIAVALNEADPDSIEIRLVGGHTAWARTKLSPKLRVNDFGYLSDRSALSKVFGESELFLFASTAENFPYVILEAMAAGCCVLVAPISGVSEQIQDGETGFIAKDNTTEAFAEKLRSVIESRKDLFSIGANARMAVEQHFSEQSMIEAHAKLYQEILDA